MADPLDYVSALGRISGKLLSEDLLRQGVDLTFRNGSADPDILYLDVNNMRVGINANPPVYDLDIGTDLKTTNLQATSQAAIDNVIFTAPKTITTSVGALHIRPYGIDPVMFHDKLTTSALEFNDNYVGSFTNQNIILDPNGSGTVQIFANTNITGNLGVSGNVLVSGNLQSAGTVTVGDQPLDTVTIVPDFTQSIIPGADITYDFGTALKRWSEAHILDWTNISTGAWPGSGLIPQAVFVSNQIKLDGVANKISAQQSNEDVLLSPDTGITYIERLKFQADEITNLNNTPITFASTGIGYTRFMDTNAIVIPSGPDDDRRASPELGETRWSTEQAYLECFDGTVWVVSTGGGEEVTTPIMEDLGNVYSLILG
jgi:hypothetical protein